MEEILALQAQLQAAVEQKSSIKLSERNVIELVSRARQCTAHLKSLVHSAAVTTTHKTRGRRVIAKTWALRLLLRRGTIRAARVCLVARSRARAAPA